MSGRREILQPTPEARKALEDTCFDLYLEGKTSPGSKLWYDCIGDPVVYGNVLVRIQAHKKEKETQQQDESASKVSSESDASTEALTGEANQEVAPAVRENRPSHRKTRSQQQTPLQVKTRSQVRKETRVSDNGPNESEEDVSRHGRGRNPCAWCRSLCKQWFST